MLALLDRIEAFLATHEERPAIGDDARVFLADFAAALAHDIDGHFAFEEDLLFPLVATAGGYELAAVLRADHDALRRLGGRLRAHCRTALANGFEPEDWTVFRAFAADYAARQQAHLAIEETTLLRIADELLAPEEDRRLAALFPRFDPAV